jgi:hypothetical protein
LFLKNQIQPIWSAGPTGAALLARIDPGKRFPALGNRLDLAQLWHLGGARALLVCPDTSVMHIGRLAGTPTVALFGPSSAQLFGAGDFWRDAPYRAVTVENFPCRDQNRLFKREIAWIRRCQRALDECRRRAACTRWRSPMSRRRPSRCCDDAGPAQFPQRLCRSARGLRGARLRGDREPVDAGAQRAARGRALRRGLSSIARGKLRRTLGLRQRLARRGGAVHRAQPGCTIQIAVSIATRLAVMAWLKPFDAYASHSMQAAAKFSVRTLYCPNAAREGLYHVNEEQLRAMRDPGNYRWDVSFFGNMDAKRYREHARRVEFLTP